MKTLQILTNIGTNDYQRLGLSFEKTYLEGDVESFEDVIADRLIHEKIAREWTQEVQREEERRQKAAQEAAVLAAMPEAERQVALEKAKKEATSRVGRTAATLPATPANISHNPHDADKTK